MKKIHLMSGIAAVALALLSLPAFAMGVGDAVQCRWKNGSTWYPGTIAAKTGNAVYIHYNDGDQEYTTTDKCRLLGGGGGNGGGGGGGLGVGSRVSCYWKAGSTLYPGVIASKDGDSVFIQYNDGDTEYTTLSLCQRR